MKLEYLRIGDDIYRYINSFIPDDSNNNVYINAIPCTFYDYKAAWIQLKINNKRQIYGVSMRTEFMKPDDCDAFVIKIDEHYNLKADGYYFISKSGFTGSFTRNHTINEWKKEGENLHNGFFRMEDLSMSD